MKKIEDLVDAVTPALPRIKNWLMKATNSVEVFPILKKQRDEVLVQTQISTGTILGSVIYETGGILIDHGWLRILGSGCKKMTRTLSHWNMGYFVLEPGKPPTYLLIADDAVGGVFAIDYGGLGFKKGDVAYYAPDTLVWESLEVDYEGFIRWCFGGDLKTFYADYRWPGWEDDSKTLLPDEGFLVQPFPIMKGMSLPQRRRDAIPMSELYSIYRVLGEQLKDAPPGAKVQVRYKE